MIMRAGIQTVQCKTLGLLLRLLPSYAFPDARMSISKHMALGISLGGHTAWQLVLHEPRIAAVATIIGCPDYVRLMEYRAKQAGISFAGISFAGEGVGYLPQTLLEYVREWDPAAMLKSYIDAKGSRDAALTEIRDSFGATIGGKKLLVLSGANDMLVPHHTSEPFPHLIANATDTKLGLSKDKRFELRTGVYAGVEHDAPPHMISDAVEWLVLEASTRCIECEIR
jgi:pimeloyl-ACP methyl ester carboxylesterase